MNFFYTIATIAFTSLGILLTGVFLADLLNWIRENFSDDEIKEKPAEDTAGQFFDEFESLYISVANGDLKDREHWLEALKGGDFCD